MTFRDCIRREQIESSRWLTLNREIQPIDQKGAILTQISEFWFILLQSMIPELQTHYVSMGLPPALQQRVPPEMGSQLQRRSMVVKRLKVFPIESIVRGYITGSAWNSYQKDGTVCGIKLDQNLKESEELPKPLWTPSTKAELGGKDENISPAEGPCLCSLRSHVLPPVQLPWNTSLTTLFRSCQDRRARVCRSDRVSIIANLRESQ